MTGLNLEAFLRLMNADSGFWVSAGTVGALLGLGAWSVRGRTPIISRCLALSLAAHVGLMSYAGPQAARWLVPGYTSDTELDSQKRDLPAPIFHLAQDTELASSEPPDLKKKEAVALDRPESASALDLVPLPQLKESEPVAAEPVRPADRSLAEPLLVEAPDPTSPLVEAALIDRTSPENVSLEPGTTPVESFEPVSVTVSEETLAQEEAIPDLTPGLQRASAGGSPSRMRRSLEVVSGPDIMPLPQLGPAASLRELETPVVDQEQPLSGADLIEPKGSVFSELATGPPSALPEPEISRSQRGAAVAALPRRTNIPDRVPLIRENAPSPSVSDSNTGPSFVVQPRAVPEIPEVYKSRMAPNRSAIALAGGASSASEEAVEHALKWLAIHQDPDGRWNGGRRRDSAGGVIRGEKSFTSLCPGDLICTGESYYFEADTAMTGLSLLAFLGAGQTHQAGPHANTVTNGLSFLIRTQKADGDLRGSSVNVGMYCHAIASLALCEAYALTSDRALRGPAERAVKFLMDSRTSDKSGWRYKPGDRFGGDTSILGWAVMVMKTAREVDILVPEDARTGALRWLRSVAEGSARGLAIYRPGESYPVTPTMTAEAWVCRQFLGVGGPGPASDEAASYLLQHSPDRDPFNLYYWYYATLAFYQHGGDAWERWNDRVRDQLVKTQTRGGHADGSWDPVLCKDKHDVLGGRIYTTAVATLTLEVYYRYLRLYNAPSVADPNRVEGALGADAALRRAGVSPDAASEPRPEPLPR